MEYQIQFIFLIVVMVIGMGFVLPKSKGLFVLQAGVIWILMSLNNGGGDYQGNKEFYNTAHVANIKGFFLDSGIYQGMCMIFRRFGLDFLQAYIIVSTIALLSLFLMVCRNTKKRCLVLSLFMLYPFTDFIIQKRNFLIVPILLYIFPYLFKKTKKGDLIFCIGCVAAGLIHVSGYVYFIFYFIYKILSYKKINKYFCFNILLLLGVEFLFLPLLPAVASLFFPKGKVDLYFYNMTSSKVGALYTICAHILFWGIVEYISLRGKKNNDNPILLSQLKYFCRMSLLFIPLYFYGAVFARIYIYMLPYTYILFSNIFFQIKSPGKSAFITYSVMIGSVLFIVLINYGFYRSGFSNLVIPLIEENLLVRYIL